MARKEIAVKKYVVTLSNEEREHLTALILSIADTIQHKSC